jgi:hypothetical protein
MAKRRKPQRTSSQTLIARFEETMRASGRVTEDVQIVRRNDGDAKISATFLRFIEPYQVVAKNRQQFETLVGIGVMAWNVSLFKGDKRKQAMSDVMRALKSETGQPAPSDTLALLNDFIARKEHLFAHDRRLIISYQVDELNAREYHLSMIATEDDPTPETD